MKLSKIRISQIKSWIHDSYHEHLCPFRSLPGGGEICEELFPKIKDEDEPTMFMRTCGTRHCCPCAVYTVPYVVRKARRIVKSI